MKKAVDKKYPKATLKEIMEITEVKGKDEKREGYEIVLATPDKKEIRSDALRPTARFSRNPRARAKKRSEMNRTVSAG